MTDLARQYVKLCDLNDFNDPALLTAIRSLLPERDPRAYVERKVWEFGMLMLFIEEVGLLDDATQVLSVGAGNERILYWLANRVGRVVGTDIYGDGAFAKAEASVAMLENPRAQAPWPYREDRLEVRWMDARQLTFPSASFDLVFTISSIEHFGSRSDIARSAREIGRVLKPGGYAVIVTDCLVRLHPLDAAPISFITRLLSLGRKHRRARPLRHAILGELFTPAELNSRIVTPSGLRLLQPLDRTLSPESWLNVTRASPSGELEPSSGNQYPMILLQAGRSIFTSVCLVLQKPTTGTNPRE